MTQEEKELLRKDLCARLPYNVKVHIEHDIFYDERKPYDTELDLSVLSNWFPGMEIKPYLRPMSSMTEDEEKVFLSLGEGLSYNKDTKCVEYKTERQDFLNTHHFDYRGLIEKGLALEAPEGIYGKWTSLRGNLKEDTQGNIVGGLKL